MVLQGGRAVPAGHRGRSKRAGAAPTQHALPRERAQQQLLLAAAALPPVPHHKDRRAHRTTYTLTTGRPPWVSRRVKSSRAQTDHSGHGGQPLGARRARIGGRCDRQRKVSRRARNAVCSGEGPGLSALLAGRGANPRPSGPPRM